MNYYYYYYGRSMTNTLLLWLFVIIAAILIMIMFLGKQNKGKYEGFTGSLYNFLNFRSFSIAGFIKFFYIVLSLGLGLSMLFDSFDSGFTGFIVSLIAIVVVEVIIRIIFEVIMLVVVGVSNIIEINDKLGGNSEDNPTFIDPDTGKYADKITKQANTISEKIKKD